MTIEAYDFLILYGTQTGQSKAIAEIISERSEREYGFKTKVCNLSSFDKEVRNFFDFILVLSLLKSIFLIKFLVNNNVGTIKAIHFLPSFEKLREVFIVFFSYPCKILVLSQSRKVRRNCYFVNWRR